LFVYVDHFRLEIQRGSQVCVKFEYSSLWWSWCDRVKITFGKYDRAHLYDIVSDISRILIRLSRCQLTHSSGKGWRPLLDIYRRTEEHFSGTPNVVTGLFIPWT